MPPTNRVPDSPAAPLPTPSGLPLVLPLELLLTGLKRAARFLLRAGINPPSLLYLLASALANSGCRRAASAVYDTALARADESSSRRIFKVRQEWEFATEINRARLGTPRVQDPLFDVSATPDRTISGSLPRRVAAGYYEVHVGHRGLRIDGFLRPGICAREVDVLVDGQRIRRTSVSRVVRGLNLFVVSIQREAVSALPSKCNLELRLAGGESLLFRGYARANLDIPHGMSTKTGDHLDVALDKKGFLVRPKEDVAQLQRGFLEIYAAARRFFETELGASLFVLYGTLLGQHRGADFIPGDDDFDVGYYSDANTSSAVRSEGMDFVVKLVRAGFVVTLNRGGRLFRLRLPGMPPACHLDVHAVWRERGSLWIHPRANLECSRSDFIPVRTATLRLSEVAVPANPEAFLSAYYGADWRVPNPAYSTASRKFSRWKTYQLRRSCVSPAQVKEMLGRIHANSTPTTGMLIAIGTQSIYPLDHYGSLCDW